MIPPLRPSGVKLAYGDGVSSVNVNLRGWCHRVGIDAAWRLSLFIYWGRNPSTASSVITHFSSSTDTTHTDMDEASGASEPLRRALLCVSGTGIRVCWRTQRNADARRGTLRNAEERWGTPDLTSSSSHGWVVVLGCSWCFILRKSYRWNVLVWS